MHGSHLPAGSLPTAPVKVSEYYSTVVLNARLMLPARFLVQLQMPVRFNSIKESDFSAYGNGQGDFTILLGYQGLEKRSGKKAFRFSPALGVKLPTGWQYRDAEKAINLMDLQGGSGAVDFILNPSWVARYGSWGVAGDFSFRITGRNWIGVRSGNVMNSNTALFFKAYSGEKIQLIPSAILYLEKCAGMFHGMNYMEDTRSSLIAVGGGLQMVAGKWNVKVNALVPAAQLVDHPQPLQKVMVQAEFSRAFDLNWKK
jgi:hypothetical protein